MTVKELLDGDTIILTQFFYQQTTFKKAVKKTTDESQKSLFDK